MVFLIGTDEAGYGPNLGPLLVSATMWQVEGTPADADSNTTASVEDCYARLKSAVQSPDAAGRKADSPCLVIGDSKQLYKPGQSLAGLEQGVLGALASLGDPPNTWRDIWASTGAAEPGSLDESPWYREFDMPLPTAATTDLVQAKGQRLASEGAKAGCRLVAVASRAVFPGEFNRMVHHHGNKATLLSLTTLQLVRQLLETTADTKGAIIACDKHGGRSKYGPLLNDVFPETLAVVHQESRQISRYQLGPEPHAPSIRFQAKGESFLPAALASMVSKYLRELAMKAFNTFWCREVPDLRPTAGYPVDAKRFHADIAQRQKALGIDDEVLWRCR